MDMYMENILDHYKDPHNKGSLKDPHIKNKEKNPSCGDVIEVTAIVNKDKRIIDVKFDGYGCAISQAAISMVTDDVKGKTTKEILKMKKHDILNLLGIDIVPMRIKCVMLGLRVLQRGILKFEGKNHKEIILSDME
ncbi:SUF system NifU family Fe-S cluster assembly protein [Candidatus Woesearchaeota archaeon CG10_big_fil_rev_8_21_14_0_10_34_8]|nr:MAG: SUF system NifU family Fe-S cluster assembly protein [Candidatus Woesearchaeota archaeon CG10_big_fil_rev_8_21_14_0_10_34_8]